MKLPFRASLFRLACLAVLWSAGAVFAQTVSDTIHQGLPPKDAQQKYTPSFLSNGNFRARVWLYAQQKRVDLLWTYSVSGTHETDDAAGTQAISVSFWPTSAEVVGGNVLLVAGKDRDGDTRIERWTLQLPAIATSGGSYVLSPRTPEDMTTIYEGSVQGKDMVRFMLKNLGKPSSAFVQFYDSRDLYEIEWADEPYPLTSVLTAATEPGLSQAYTTCFRGEHLAQGYAYVFSAPESYGQIPHFLLLDSDKDGTLDAHSSVSFATYLSMGMTELDNWVSQSGLPHTP